MKNPKLSDQTAKELRDSGLSDVLSMDEMVTLAGFDYITRHLLRIFENHSWYFEGSTKEFPCPEEAAAHYWLKKPL